jgi:hypothetical protein
MAHWIYSTEALPNPALMGKPGYTPDQEFVKWGGATLPPIPAKEWMKLPDSFDMLRRADWRDRQGTHYEIPITRFKGIIDARFAERGVVFLDHPPSNAEKETLEAVSAELNLQFRRSQVEWYESQVREKEVTGHGRTKPTPYEDECYSLLGIEKPYSAKALQAQRDPGRAAAKEIADAIAGALNRRESETVDALASKESTIHEKAHR